MVEKRRPTRPQSRARFLPPNRGAPWRAFAVPARALARPAFPVVVFLTGDRAASRRGSRAFIRSVDKNDRFSVPPRRLPSGLRRPPLRCRADAEHSPNTPVRSGRGGSRRRFRRPLIRVRWTSRISALGTRRVHARTGFAAAPRPARTDAVRPRIARASVLQKGGNGYSRFYCARGTTARPSAAPVFPRLPPNGRRTTTT